jgi:5-methylcytosine-specific restriction protein A
MASRAFRTEASIAAEQATRRRVEALLERHGFDILDREWIERGSAITQVIVARTDNTPPMRMHVRLCWRRDGRNARENLYSAAQLRARLIDGDWDKTLATIAAREARDGNSHMLLVQDSAEGFVFAAILPCDQIPAIWEQQRQVSANLQARGLSGTLTKNHAANGASPTLWLQDDRFPATGAVAQVLWQWPGVINVLALPARNAAEQEHDSYDDLPLFDGQLGRDGADPIDQRRSGYPRDPKVRAAVRKRAKGKCEREGCGTHRSFDGFLDVHHILGVGVSDRVWSCVALCPNCHREAHFSPDRDEINAALGDYARAFAEN